MYLYKDLDNFKNIPIDFNEYLSSFAFYKFIYDEKRDEFKKRNKNEDELKKQADFAAAVIAQLSFTIDSDDIVQKGLRCCRDILISKGYKETTVEDIHKEVHSAETNHMVLVPGCQSDHILESRIKASVDLIEILDTSIEITLIGSFPPKGKYKNPNESIRMKNFLDQEINRRKLKNRIKNVHVFIEDTSKTTYENAKKFFKNDYISSDRQYYLYLVSSNFHLLRFTKDCEDNFFSTSDIKKNIERITLFGADDIHNPSTITREGGYIKLMFFDIFCHLMTEEEFYKT